jgi:hypothetical protein
VTPGRSRTLLFSEVRRGSVRRRGIIRRALGVAAPRTSGRGSRRSPRCLTMTAGATIALSLIQDAAARRRRGRGSSAWS